MKVDIEDLSSVKKKLVVTFPKEEVEKGIKNELMNIGKVAQIRGFRKGKAPFSLVEKTYMPEAMERYADKTIRESLKNIVDEKKLNLANSPVIEKQDFLEDGFSFHAVVELHPEVNLNKYQGLTFKKQKMEVTEEQVSAKIEEFRKNGVTLEDKENGSVCEDGDIAKVEIFKFEVDGKEIGSNFHEDIDLSKKEIFPEIREALVGAKVGEKKEIKIKYADDLPDEKLAGKEGYVSFEVKGLKKYVYPTDDQLLEKMGVGSMDDLKEKVKKDLMASLKSEAERKFREDVFKKLSEENPFEVPPTSIDELAYKMAEDLYNSYKRYGLDPDKLSLDWNNVVENYKIQAERNLKQQYIMKAIKEKENIDVTEEELEQKLEELFGNIPEKEKIKFYQNNNLRTNLYVDMISKKVFDFILSQNTVEEE